MQSVGKARMSYEQGDHAHAIGEIVAKYVDYENLNIHDDNFVDAATIDPAKGTPQIRQMMVKYLVDIGLMVSRDDLIPAGTPPGGGSTGPSGSGSTGPSGTPNPSGRKVASEERDADGGSPEKPEAWAS